MVTGRIDEVKSFLSPARADTDPSAVWTDVTPGG